VVAICNLQFRILIDEEEEEEEEEEEFITSLPWQEPEEELVSFSSDEGL